MSSSRRKRVLMLIENQFFPRDIRVFQEARSLIAKGYQVSVVCPGQSGQPRQEIIDDVNVFRYPSSFATNGPLGYIWEYGYSLIATWILSLFVWVSPGFDIIHAANPPDTEVFIAVFYKLFGKRFIFDQHDLSPELYEARFGNRSNKFIHQMLIWLEILSCRLADHVIATNQSYKTLEILRGKIPESRITIVRNGPTSDFLELFTLNPTQIAQEKLKITYVGTMGFQDGVDCLFRAIYHLVNDFHRADFHCTLVGSGDALPMLQSLAKELHIEDYLTFTGWVTRGEVAHYINKGDICVSPEPSDPYNDRSTIVKIIEYMALGKPIVAFDLPEHRNSARDAAIYALPNDELDFARKLNFLMDDAEKRAEMGQSGRARVEQELSWHHQEINLIEAYNKLK
jgi:glycosyltransferase involved in cell wall biosynthesis